MGEIIGFWVLLIIIIIAASYIIGYILLSIGILIGLAISGFIVYKLVRLIYHSRQKITKGLRKMGGFFSKTFFILIAGKKGRAKWNIGAIALAVIISVLITRDIMLSGPVSMFYKIEKYPLDVLFKPIERIGQNAYSKHIVTFYQKNKYEFQKIQEEENKRSEAYYNKIQRIKGRRYWELANEYKPSPEFVEMQKKMAQKQQEGFGKTLDIETPLETIAVFAFNFPIFCGLFALILNLFVFRIIEKRGQEPMKDKYKKLTIPKRPILPVIQDEDQEKDRSLLGEIFDNKRKRISLESRMKVVEKQTEALKSETELYRAAYDREESIEKINRYEDEKSVRDLEVKLKLDDMQKEHEFKIKEREIDLQAKERKARLDELRISKVEKAMESDEDDEFAERKKQLDALAHILSYAEELKDKVRKELPQEQAEKIIDAIDRDLVEKGILKGDDI